MGLSLLLFVYFDSVKSTKDCTAVVPGNAGMKERHCRIVAPVDEPINPTRTPSLAFFQQARWDMRRRRR